MNSFTVILRDMQREQRLENVQAFSSKDASGSFSLLAKHTAFLTVTEAGLSELRTEDKTLFIGATEALLEFDNNELQLGTRRFFMDENPDNLQAQLKAWQAEEQQSRAQLHGNLQRLDAQLLMRLYQQDK